MWSECNKVRFLKDNSYSVMKILLPLESIDVLWKISLIWPGSWREGPMPVSLRRLSPNQGVLHYQSCNLTGNVISYSQVRACDSPSLNWCYNALEAGLRESPEAKGLQSKSVKNQKALKWSASCSRTKTCFCLRAWKVPASQFQASQTIDQKRYEGTRDYLPT